MLSISVVGSVLPLSTVRPAKSILNFQLNSIKNLSTKQTHYTFKSHIVLARAAVGQYAQRPLIVHIERFLLLTIYVHVRQQ